MADYRVGMELYDMEMHRFPGLSYVTVYLDKKDLKAYNKSEWIENIRNGIFPEGCDDMPLFQPFQVLMN